MIVNFDLVQPPCCFFDKLSTGIVAVHSLTEYESKLQFLLLIVVADMFGNDIQSNDIFLTLPRIQVKTNFRKKEPHTLNNRYRVFETLKSLNERFSHICESVNRDGQNCDLVAATKKMPSSNISLVCKEDIAIQRIVKGDWNNAKPESGNFLHNCEGVNNVQKYGFQTLKNQNLSNGFSHEETISITSISSPSYPSIEHNYRYTHETGGEKLYGYIPKLYTAGEKISSNRSLSPSLTSDEGNKATSNQLEGIYTPTDMSLCSDQENENGPGDKATPNKGNKVISSQLNGIYTPTDREDENVLGDKAAPNKSDNKFQCFKFEASKATVQKISLEDMSKSEDSVSTVEHDVEHSLPVDVTTNSQAVGNLQKKMRSQRNFGDEDILNEGLVELEKSFSRRIRECNLNSQSNPQKPLTFHERTLLVGNVPPVAIPLELTSNEQCLKWHDGQLVSCKRDPRLEKASKKKHRRCSLIKLSYGKHQNKDMSKTMNLQEYSAAPSNTSSLSSTIISSDGEGGTAKNLSCESSSTSSMKTGKTATNFKLDPKSNYSCFTEGSDCMPRKQNYYKDNENQHNLNTACQTPEATSSLCDKETIPGLDLIMNVVDLHYKKDSDIAQLRDIVIKQKTSAEFQPKTNVDAQPSLSQLKSTLNYPRLTEYLNLLPQLTTTKHVESNKLQKVPVNTSTNVLQSSELESYHTAKKQLPAVNEATEMSKYKENSASLPININSREQNKLSCSSFLSEDLTGKECKFKPFSLDMLKNMPMMTCCQTNDVFKILLELLTEAGKIQDIQKKDRKLTEALEVVEYALKTHNCHFA